jgi:hypothetical protein
MNYIFLFHQKFDFRPEYYGFFLIFRSSLKSIQAFRFDVAMLCRIAHIFAINNAAASIRTFELGIPYTNISIKFNFVFYNQLDSN